MTAGGAGASNHACPQARGWTVCLENTEYLQTNTIKELQYKTVYFIDFSRIQELQKLKSSLNCLKAVEKKNIRGATYSRVKKKSICYIWLSK